MKEDIKEFFSSSLQCLMNRGTKETNITLKMKGHKIGWKGK